MSVETGGFMKRAMKRCLLYILSGLALAALPARSRLLLALRFGRGYSARRIATAMGFPSVFHVYRSINRVLGELRSELQRLGVREPHP